MRNGGHFGLGSLPLRSCVAPPDPPFVSVKLLLQSLRVQIF